MSNGFDEEAYQQVMIFVGADETDHGDVDWGDDDGDDNNDHTDNGPSNNSDGDRPRLRIEVTLPLSMSISDAEALVAEIILSSPLNATTALTSSLVHLGAGEITQGDVGFGIQFEAGDYHVDGVLQNVSRVGQDSRSILLTVNDKPWLLGKFDVVRLGMAQ